MANTILNIAMITNETLMVLENELTFTRQINRDYDDRFAIAGAKIGATVNARKPARFKGTLGPNLNVEDFNETSVPVVLDHQFHVDTQFTTQDLTLNLDDFSDRVIKPAMATLANKVDNDMLTIGYQSIGNFIGTPGTTPNTALLWLQAKAILASEAAPAGSRVITMDPWTNASMVDAMKGLFNPQVLIGSQIEKGMVAKHTLGFDWFEDQNVVAMTVGAQGGSPVFSSTGTSSAIISSGWADNGTLQTSGWTAAAAARLNVGDVFTIGSVYMVNPQSRKSVGPNRLRGFVVLPYVGTPLNGTFAPSYDTDNATIIGGTYSSKSDGTLSLQIAPAIITGGQFQNVSAAPSNGATITVNGAGGTVSPQNLAFHKDFMTLATADLELPEGVHFAGRSSDKKAGLSVRIVRQYTINNDALPCRMDMLYGGRPLYRELGVRVAG